MERDFAVCRAESSSMFIRRIQERARVIDTIEKIGSVAAVTLWRWGCKAEATLGLALDRKAETQTTLYRYWQWNLHRSLF